MTENTLAEQIYTNPFTEIGSSYFEKFATSKTAIFVDKTLFVKEVINSKDVTLITRPRRWGKSLNMSMLEYFFSIPVKADGTIDEVKRQQKYEILSKMAIGSYKNIIDDACCKYPTIFVSFKDIKGASYSSIEEGIRNLIYKLYASHKYLLSSNKLDDINKTLFKKFLTKEFDVSELKDSILTLSEMLSTHFNNPVIVLIDEYDTPMNDWYARKLSSGDKIDSEHDSHLQDVLGLFRGIFSAVLKDNKYLYKGVITGILRIAKSSLFSGLNNFTEDSILDDNYSKYFGFTEEEVGWLLHESGMDRDQSIVEQMKSWYNGYNIGGITIYNPWSIMNWLSTKGKFRAYWVGTASTTLIENALILDAFQDEVQSLIEGNTVEMTADPKMVFSEINSSPNALYNLLLFSGYLTAVQVENAKGGAYTCLVRIPNQEVGEVFEISIQRWVSGKLGIEIDKYSTFINKLLEGDVDTFRELLKEYLEVSASFYSLGPKNAELFYNAFMMGLMASISNRYFVETEKESGSGRADLMLIPKSNAKHRNAIVMEFKSANKTENLVSMATSALEQIKNKNYISKIQTYENVSKVISVGLAFCGKNVEIMHMETDLNLNTKDRSSLD